MTRRDIYPIPVDEDGTPRFLFEHDFTEVAEQRAKDTCLHLNVSHADPEPEVGFRGYTVCENCGTEW